MYWHTQLLLALTLLTPVFVGGQKATWPTLSGEPPKMFGHGGEKFYMPEHTAGSYELAAIEGADYVEPDLVLTKDEVFVCFHDLALKRSTDIEEHPEFAHLRGNHSVIIDGKNQTIVDDWLVIHLTLNEVRSLRVNQQPNGVRLQYFNELFTLSTFQEFIDSIHTMALKLNKPIGLIPELKHPQFHNTVFNTVERYMENKMLEILRSNGYPLNAGDSSNCRAASMTIECGPIILQSFDRRSLEYLSGVVNHSKVELMMLVHPDVYLLTPQGFSEVANFSDYFCLWKEYMYTGVEAEIEFKGWEYDEQLVDDMGGFYRPLEFVPEAHRLGLKMALFTIPDSRESSGRGCAIRCDPVDKELEMNYFFQMGVDGMFTENIPEATFLRMKFDYELQIANLTQTLDAKNEIHGLKYK